MSSSLEHRTSWHTMDVYSQITPYTRAQDTLWMLDLRSHHAWLWSHHGHIMDTRAQVTPWILDLRSHHRYQNSGYTMDTKAQDALRILDTRPQVTP